MVFSIEKQFFAFQLKKMYDDLCETPLTEESPNCKYFPHRCSLEQNRVRKAYNKRIQNNQVGDACAGSKASASSPASSGQAHA